MLVSYNWLKDYLDLEIDPNELANEVTLTGIEIASVTHLAAGLKKIVAGHVVGLAPHPDSDHLQVAQVDVGEAEPIQIVCGAPNIANGQTVIVALHGARIAGNEKIKRSKMRGVVSNGMICSLQEIGFDESVVPKDYADGIYVFEEEIAPGTPVYEALGMDDYVLDFDITPNRADTLSMEGAAYEVGAITNQLPTIKHHEPIEALGQWQDDFTVTVDKQLTHKYLLRKIHGIQIKKSPMWLQRRLMSAGVRPINNVVDITNYVMLVTGQPLHAFDAGVIKTNRIDVRLAQKGEQITLLNGNEIELDEADLLITDGEQPIGLAGVMGGMDSEITTATQDVLLESAIFDGAHIRKTAQRHNLRSEASNRFEKGLNWDNTRNAADLAAYLLEQLADGQTYEGLVVGQDEEKPQLTINVSTDHVNHVLGTEITTEQIATIFSRLGFSYQKSASATAVLEVNVPNRRFDIFIEADLIEEVARIYGYDNLPATLPSGMQTLGGYSKRETLINHWKNLLQNQGLIETINYSLTDETKSKLFTKNQNGLIKVEWPLNSSRTAMRQNLLSGLLEAVAYNVARSQKDLRLYEQGRVFDQFGQSFDEYEHIAAVYTGDAIETNWQHITQKTDFYYVKGQVEYLLDQMGVLDTVAFKELVLDGMHATRTAGVYLGEQLIGFVGQVDPSITKKMKAHDVYGFELNLEPLLESERETVTTKPAPKFPAIKRDLSLLVSATTPNAVIEDVIFKNAGKDLLSLTVFDVYAGAKIAHDQKSIAYQLVFQNEARTLTDSEIEEAMDKITASLRSELQIVVR